MSNFKSSREFGFAESDLAPKCEATHTLTLRDEAELLAKGFTSEKRTAFRVQIDDYKKLPTDNYWLGLCSSGTENKNNNRLIVEKGLRGILTFAENKWGVKSAKYKQFGAGSISKFTDDELLRCVRTAIGTARYQLADLASEGLTAAMIDQLETSNQTFDKSIDDQKTAERNRDIATDERILKGNQLYRSMVKICNLGKDIWYGINQAKYNDYLIYEGASGTQSKPLNPDSLGVLSGVVSDALTGNPVPSAIVSINGISVTAVSDPNGEFNFDSIPEGIYIVNVAANDYLPWSQPGVEISADEATELDVKLVK